MRKASHGSKPRYIRPVFGIALLLFLLIPSSLNAADWPQWRGPNQNGISPETNWTDQWGATGPKRLWKANVGIGFSSMAVSDGFLYTLGNINDVDTVYCFDAATGSQVWKYSYPCPRDPRYYDGGPGATPAINGNSLFTLSKKGHLFSFNRQTGEVLWQRNIAKELNLPLPEWGFSGSPLVIDNTLFLNAGSHGLALDKASGEVLWNSGSGLAGYAAPVPAMFNGTSGLFIFAAAELTAVNAKDGSLFWSYPWKTKWKINAADPIVSNDRVFISSHDLGGALLQFNKQKSELIWKNRNMRNHFNSCVLVDGYLYGIDGNTDQPGTTFRCIDFKTGDVQWTEPGLGLGSVIAAGHRLLILTDKGELIAAKASPSGFELLARAHVLGGKCWIPPALADGRLYCRNAEGDLICLNLQQ